MGVKLAEKTQKTAHIKIYLGSNNDKNPFSGIQLDLTDNDLLVINKTDLKKKHNIKPNISISLKNEKKFLNKKRQKNHLKKAENSLNIVTGRDLEIMSLHIRDALKSIDSITKETDNEEVLGIIFGKFCIGK